MALEGRAVILCHQAIHPQAHLGLHPPIVVKSRNIRWRIDFSAALDCVRKVGEGGTCRPLVLGRALVWAHQRPVRLLPVYFLTREDTCRGIVSFPGVSGLATSPHQVPCDCGRIGAPRDRPLRQPRLQTDKTLLQLARLRQLRKIRRLFTEVRLPSSGCLSAGRSPQESEGELGTLRGSFVLVSPLWEAQTCLASLLALRVLGVRRLPFLAGRGGTNPQRINATEPGYPP
jgi:hypothetical protein